MVEAATLSPSTIDLNGLHKRYPLVEVATPPPSRLDFRGSIRCALKVEREPKDQEQWRPPSPPYHDNSADAPEPIGASVLSGVV